MNMMFIYTCVFFLFPLALNALEITTSGEFLNCQPPGSGESQCTFYNTSNPLGSQVRWAKPANKGHERSGLGYIGRTSNFSLSPPNKPQLIGILQHYNWPVTGYVPDTIDFNLNLTFLDGTRPSKVLSFTLDIDETLNQVTDLINGTCEYASNLEWFGEWNGSFPCCPYFTPKDPCSDRIRFHSSVNINETFAINDTLFTLQIDGFFDGVIVEFFITQEGNVTTGSLFGRLVQTCKDTCEQISCFTSECISGICDFYPIPEAQRECLCFSNCTECISHGCYWCSGECTDQNGLSCTSDCEPSIGGDDDSTSDVVPIVVATLAACYCLLCLLVGLAGLGGLSLLFIGKYPLFRQASAVRSGNFTLHGAQTNPLHTPRFTSTDNPSYE